MPSETFSQNYVFGTGRIYAVNTGTGAVPSFPTVVQPNQFLSIQEATVDETITIKPLDSSYEFPDVEANADRKVTGKVTFGRVDLLLLNDIVFGETSFATGGTLISGNEAGTVPGTTPYTVTVQQSATWAKDLGVYYVSNGQQLQQVSSPTAAGEYSVAAGVYTFYSADANSLVLISYTYTTTSGYSVTTTSKLMGLNQRPVFALYLSMPSGSAAQDLYLHACRASKFMRPWKRDDFLKLELDFDAYPDASGQVYTWSSAT